MGKMESIMKAEIGRLSRREMRKLLLPINRELKRLRSNVSELRKTVGSLQRTMGQRETRMVGEVRLEASPEEIKKSRFSPRLIRKLRERLGITQKEMASLLGVTVGAIFQWEKGMFEPRDDKKGAMIRLRQMGRREVRKLLDLKKGETAPQEEVRAKRGATSAIREGRVRSSRKKA